MSIKKAKKNADYFDNNMNLIENFKEKASENESFISRFENDYEIKEVIIFF